MRTLDRGKPVHKKPWASLIAIAALVASVSASAGELDGKAIVCTSDHEHVAVEALSLVAFEFMNGAVTGRLISTQGTNAVIDEFGVGVKDRGYREEPGTVSWWSGYYLDRVTLVLRFYGSSRDHDEPKYKWQCQVSPSLESHRQFLEARREQAQKSIDESMKDNKI